MLDNNMNWVYDDPGWWINAVHFSCSQHGTGDRLLGEPLSCNKVEDVPSLSDIQSGYEDTLALLSGGTLTIEGAATMLFRAKALKKWKLADPQYAVARKTKAILGFIERNAEAQDAEPIPYPYCVEMRRILESWLPDPEKSGYVWTGRFGPGNCAEKWSHPERFEGLVGWCDSAHPVSLKGNPGRRVIAANSGFLNGHWPEVPLTCGDAQHVTARLHAVAKDFAKDRLITIEPAYATFAQAYVREAIQASIHIGPLAGTCMDLNYTDGQAIQQRLALKASRTLKNATIDLSDASDRITWNQVKQVFPNWVLSMLDTTRSECFKVDEPQPLYGTVQVPGRLVSSSVEIPRGYTSPMYIYAGMGNGTTFTIETLFFAAFVKAYAFLHSLPGYVSVFGDDIICHSETACALKRESFSFFRINQRKSFVASDALRESCGVFAYKGVDITAPKVDGYPNTWEGRTALCDLHRRLKALPWVYAQRLSYFIAHEGVLVNWPHRYGGYPSIDDDRCQRSLAPQTRWNAQYQRKEANLPVRTAKKVSYPTDWMTAKRHNHPDPRAWYYAYLLGMLGRRDYVIRKNGDRRRWSVDFPVKGMSPLRRDWVPPIDWGTPADNSAQREWSRTPANRQRLGR